MLPIGQTSLSIYPVVDIPAGEGKRTVMVGAVPRKDVATVVAACRAGKTSPKAVDLSAAAVLRCMTRTATGNHDVATIVDIGATKVTVATRQGAHLRSVRTIALGSDDITRAIMGELDCQYDEAEKYKFSSRAGRGRTTGSAIPGEDSAPIFSEYGSVKVSDAKKNSDSDVITSAVSTAATGIAIEIANCVETDASRNPSNTTRGVVLCGRGSLLLGMKELVSDQIGVPVMLGRPWATLVPGRRTSAALDIAGDEESVMLSLATAIGLALWKDPLKS